MNDKLKPTHMDPDNAEIKARTVYIGYTNYRGDYDANRRIVPLGTVFYGVTAWHKEPQWLLHAFDLDRQAERTFAIKDIVNWSVTFDGTERCPVCGNIERV